MHNEEEFEEKENQIDPLREDKIFNNGYKSGHGLPDGEEFEFTKKISVSNEYSDNYLKDLYDSEEFLETRVILDTIFEFLKKDDWVRVTLAKKAESNSAKVKLSKAEVNKIFMKVHEEIDSSPSKSSFYNPIYVLEAISSISSIEYKKLFDLLDTEIQEILLIELNKKYGILDGKFKKRMTQNDLD